MPNPNYESLSPNGHETMITRIFQKLKGWVESLLNNKADKATTLSGYGITDAKIESGTITLGNDSITPLSSAVLANYVAKAGDTMTGALWITSNNTGLILHPLSGEGGEIHLDASEANDTQAGIVLDQYDSKLRIFGIPSADGTTKTGVGTPLSIDPYSKNISGNYIFTGRATESYVPRVNENSQFKPGANTSIIKEFDSRSSNLPSADWYHIYTSEGSDTNYAVQLALGMTTNKAYYRNCNNNTWNGWVDLNASNRVAKAGDTMSGTLTFNKVTNAISYQGTHATYPMIKFIDNTTDGNGNGIYIGGGGQTIIGGGESANAMAGQVGTAGGEIMYIGNDSDVHIHTNLQNGWSSKKTFTFGSGGRLTIPEYCYASYFNQSSGAETPSTSSYMIYANSDGFFRKSTLANVKTILGLGSAAYRGVYDKSAVGHFDWDSYKTNLVTNAAIAFWNGRYNSGSSNLQYCDRGRFGTVVTAASDTYVSKAKGTYTGNGYTGYCVAGRDTGHFYQLNWTGSALQHYVDGTNVGSSDMRLKKDKKRLTDDEQILDIIDECGIYSYKHIDDDDKTSFGIMAQAFKWKCKERGLNPEDYVLFQKTEHSLEDYMQYYTIEYDQYLVLKCASQDRKINRLEQRIKELEDKLQ